jgi:hypothetical protein
MWAIGNDEFGFCFHELIDTQFGHCLGKLEILFSDIAAPAAA